MDIFQLLAQVKQKAPPGGPPSFLVVGLGNPGKQYEQTRHNTGFMALDFLAEQEQISVNRLKFQALRGQGTIGGVGALLLKPQTFMNLSGESVARAAAFYQIPPEHILVFFDDVSLPPGRLRLREKGSAGGHNGIKSIIASLGSENFPRIKIGVGEKPACFTDLADWVLSSYSKEERKTLEGAFEKVAAAAPLLLRGNLNESRNRLNGS